MIYWHNSRVFLGPWNVFISWLEALPPMFLFSKPSFHVYFDRFYEKLWDEIFLGGLDSFLGATLCIVNISRIFTKNILMTSLKSQLWGFLIKPQFEWKFSKCFVMLESFCKPYPWDWKGAWKIIWFLEVVWSRFEIFSPWLKCSFLIIVA